MCALPDESSAIDVYLPTGPLLSTVVVTHESEVFVAILEGKLLES